MATRTAKLETADLASNFISQDFVGLPLETIYRIVSAAQEALIPCMNKSAMEKKYAERRKTLSVLCQVCRSLRVALLPLLWERLEACCLPGNQENKSDLDRWKLLAKKLTGQLEVISVIQPLHASYVRIVNIAIEPRVADEMVHKLAPALALMQNLHTIQIVIDPRSKFQTSNGIRLVGSALFYHAFKGRLYPSAKRAVLPGQALYLLRCLPEVLEVCLNQADPYCGYFVGFFENLARSCNKLKRFGWIEFPTEKASRAVTITENLPNIRGLECHMKDFDANEISQLSRLQNLEELSLIIDAYDNLSQCNNLVLEVIEVAKKALATSTGINKRLNVMLRTEIRSFTL